MAYDISVERQTVLTCEPHLTALSFMTKHEDATKRYGDKLPKDFVASTDGRVIWYGPMYAKLDRAGRNFVFIHEMLHGIFMHGKRTALLKMRYGFVFPSLANYAADAIINEGILANPAMMRGLFDMPREFPGILMKTLHSAIQEAQKFSGESPPSDYDPKAQHGQQMEVVYSWLCWAKDAVERKRKENQCPSCKQEKPKGAKQPKKDKGQDKGDQPDGQDQGDQPGDGQPGGDQPGDGGNGDSEGNGEGCGGNGKPKNCPECGQPKPQKGKGKASGGGSGGGGQPGDEDGEGEGDGQPDDRTQIERMADEPVWDMEQDLEQLREALRNGETPASIIEALNRDIDEARQRIQAIVQGAKLAGTGAGNILLALENDLPQAVVPWNRKLRKLITRDLGTRMDDSYTRYGNSTRSAIAMRQRSIPFSPGTTIFTERPRVLVIMDVSGSHISQINQCMAEVWSIAQMKGASVDVITFDDGVQQKFEITSRADLRKIIGDGLRGAGGTCLNGVFEEISKMRTPYRACVIMTDGYLSPPSNNTKKINIVWMVTAGGTSKGLEDSGEIIFLPDYQLEQPIKQAA